MNFIDKIFYIFFAKEVDFCVKKWYNVAKRENM